MSDLHQSYLKIIESLRSEIPFKASVQTEFQFPVTTSKGTYQLEIGRFRELDETGEMHCVNCDLLSDHGYCDQCGVHLMFS